MDKCIGITNLIKLTYQKSMVIDKLKREDVFLDIMLYQVFKLVKFN